MIPQQPEQHGEESPSKPSGDPLAEAAKEWHEKAGDKSATTSAHAAESDEGGIEAAKPNVADASACAEGDAGSGDAAEKSTGGATAEGAESSEASENPRSSPIADRLHAVEHSIATHASEAVELVVQAEQSIQHAIGHGFEAVKKKIVGESGVQSPSTPKAA